MICGIMQALAPLNPALSNPQHPRPNWIGLQNGSAEYDNLRGATMDKNGSIILAGGYGYWNQTWMARKLDSNGTQIWEWMVSLTPAFWPFTI